LLLLSTVAVSCGQETHGGARKGDDPGEAPLFISEAEDGAFLKEAEARLKELRSKVDRVEGDVRKSAGGPSARNELDEAKKRLAEMENDLEKLRAEGTEVSKELFAGFKHKEEELEIFLSRATSGTGGN
jgi:tetrahydromethanopterin S-methyltransferase subunit G